MRHKEQILKLRAEGKSYPEIQRILGCSRGTIAYHCGPTQKEKTTGRRKKRHPLKIKFYGFINDRDSRTGKSLRLKDGEPRWIDRTDFTYEDLVNYIGPNPVCYYTGRSINLLKSSSYSLDHIIPVCDGGSNKLDNLALSCSEANLAKHKLSHDSFIQLCCEVAKHHC